MFFIVLFYLFFGKIYLTKYIYISNFGVGQLVRRKVLLDWFMYNFLFFLLLLFCYHYAYYHYTYF